MKVLKHSIGAVAAVLLVTSVHADPVFSDMLTTWSFSLNNGVGYITSPQLPANCQPARAEIKMSGSEYDQALFRFVLDAKNRGVSIRVVVDNGVSRCVVLGIQ